MYTVEVYKADRRTKKGERLLFKRDYDTENLSVLEHSVRHTWSAAQGFRYVIHKTFVTRKNLMTGKEFQERYDTPWTSSPASESFWSQ